MYSIKRRAAYLAIFFAFAMQMMLSNFHIPQSVRPNLMIIMVVFFALFTDKRFAFETGLVSGFLLDIFSIRFFGLNAVLFACCGYVIGKYNGKFYRESVITHIIITFAVSFLILSLYYFAINLRPLSAAPLPSGPPRIFASSVFVVSLINAFLGVWIYAFLCRVLRVSEKTI